MNGAGLTGFCTCDLVGMVRGRQIPSGDVERRLRGGVGWVPANQSLTPFGVISALDPHGPIGDVRLLPDVNSRVTVDFGEDAPRLDFFLSDIVDTAGRPWDCCPRTFLASSLKDLEDEAGLRLKASFEHEFQFVDAGPSPPPFSLMAHRCREPFGTMVIDALEQAGVEPELFVAEFGPHQFEIPWAPAEGVRAADRSVIGKEIIREVARLLGSRVTFTPLLNEDAGGNGCHIHFSLLDRGGRSVMYDEARPGRLSSLAGQFAAGVLRHAAALSAFVSPTAVSFLRLTPHRWSVGAACLGERNREALLRIAPVLEMPGHDPAEQCNLEFRGADATACPYLALGAIVRAGLEGVRHGLECPPILDCDPEELSSEELEHFQIAPLPRSLPDALDCLNADETARTWLPPLLLDTYIAVKRGELTFVDGHDNNEICKQYAAVY